MPAASVPSAPLRVVHLCRTGWPHVGGMETVVHGLARALVRRGHDARVVTLDRALSDGGPLPAGTCDGVPYARVRRLGPRRYPFARGLLAELRGADLVHVHGVDGLCDLAVALRPVHRARVGVSTHGGFWHTSRHRRLKAAWLRTVTRLTLRRADAVWFTSEHDARALAPAARGTVIGDGVDVDRFAAVVRRPEPGRFVIVGRIDVHKGVDDAIDALAALGRVDPRPFHLHVLGPERLPGLSARLRDRAAAAGVPATFHGEVAPDALLDALSTAELALFPSRYEGFGVGVVEAMAAGVPVVASSIEAFDALIRPGVDGWRVDLRDPAAAAARIAALRDHAGRVSAAARVAAARWSWDALAPRWEAAYAEVIGR